MGYCAAKSKHAINYLLHMRGNKPFFASFKKEKAAGLELWLGDRPAWHAWGPGFHPHSYSMNICSYTYLFEKWRLCIHILQENLDNHALSCSLKYRQMTLGVSPPFILSCIFSHFKSYTFHLIIRNLLRSIYFKEWKLQKLKGNIWLLVSACLLWFWLCYLGIFPPCLFICFLCFFFSSFENSLTLCFAPRAWLVAVCVYLWSLTFAKRRWGVNCRV